MFINLVQQTPNAKFRSAPKVDTRSRFRQRRVQKLNTLTQ